MKSAWVLSALVACVLAAAPSARATEVKVDVPFDFVVAGQQLPPGEYSFVRGESSSFVRIYARSQSAGPVVLAACVPAASGRSDGAVVFHKHGGQRFLKMISTGGGQGLALPESDVERGAHAAQAGNAGSGRVPSGH